MRLIDDGYQEKLAGVVALVPVSVHPDAVPLQLKDRCTAYDENAENTVNTNSAMKAFFGVYTSVKM
jgi:versiconal hemiacetal acetate esterase